jgi:hypothetical protein
MRPSVPRRFTLADSMVLIAATAIALPLMCWLFPVAEFLWKTQEWTMADLLEFFLKASVLFPRLGLPGAWPSVCCA